MNFTIFNLINRFRVIFCRKLLNSMLFPELSSNYVWYPSPYSSIPHEDANVHNSSTPSFRPTHALLESISLIINISASVETKGANLRLVTSRWLTRICQVRSGMLMSSWGGNLSRPVHSAHHPSITSSFLLVSFGVIQSCQQLYADGTSLQHLVQLLSSVLGWWGVCRETLIGPIG